MGGKPKKGASRAGGVMTRADPEPGPDPEPGGGTQPLPQARSAGNGTRPKSKKAG